jgi:hypothetical protein
LQLVSPALGFTITAFVLWNINSNAKIVGLAWMATGLSYYAALRITRRSTKLAQAID